MLFSQLPDVLLILVELLPLEEATCLATASVSTLRNLEAASRMLSSKGLPGMKLWWHPFRGAVFQQMRECVQPHTLVDVACCACNACHCVKPMALTLETTGTYFVRFHFWAGGAQNECPCIGVVDSSGLRRDRLCKCCGEETSTHHQPWIPSKKFLISCDPYSGKIQACNTPSLPPSVHEDALGDLPDHGTSSRTNWRTEVMEWQTWAHETAESDGFSVGVGMLISNGTLEFIRQMEPLRSDVVERSGVVWDNLPAEVVCCAFLFGFVGQALISLEEFLVNEVPDIIHTESTVHGKVFPWLPRLAMTSA
mmetsp:Transcript_69428/g.137274  ORF Transcript_69428/g.137274 Transcript_69428/m.137274 type:complete len:309 (-) Transcript_69428:5-931(-)